MAISNNSTGLRPGVCTSTTRPTAPYEGQMIYETDTDMVAIWNGSAWRYLAATTPTNGTVLQIQSTTLTEAVTMTPTANTWTDVTGFSISITPKSTSSTVLVIANISGMSAVGANDGRLRLMRNSTAIAVATNFGSRTASTTTFNKLAGGSIFNAPFSHLDSPATTSATTYKLQVNTGTGSIYFNRTETDSDNNSYPRTVSNITLMEIAG